MVKLFKAMVIAILMMLLPVEPISAQQGKMETFETNGFTFVVKDITKPDASATVTRTTLSGNIVIPPTVEWKGRNYNVTNIAQHFIHSQYSAKPTYKTVTSITLPSTIKSIETGAFGVSEVLTEIKIQGENNFFTVQDGILYNKDKTTLVYCPCQIDATNFSFPSTVKELSGNAFSKNILKSITIPKHIIKLNDGIAEGAYGSSGTFFGCENLTSLTFEQGENYTYIPAVFLSKSINLPSFLFPETIKKIGDYAFKDCEKLIVTLPSKLERIGFRSFEGCDALKEITFPKTVNSLASEAFNACGGLEKLTIPEECPLTYISSSCFRYNVMLKDVKLSNRIKIIHNDAFSICRALPAINLPQHLQTIGTRAFSDCISLKEVKFYEELENINEGAFSNCSKLPELNLPESLKYIGFGAFHNTACTTITIPSNVTSIGICAFLQMKNLKKIILKSNKCNCTLIDDVLFTADKKTLLAYPAKSEHRITYTVPAGVETIEEGALSYNNLTHITLPTSLETIYAGAFAYNSYLKELTIPTNVEVIGKYHESNYKSYGMGSYNIIEETNVENLYVLPTTPPQLITTLGYTPKKFPPNTTIYLKKSVDESKVYQNHINWQSTYNNSYAHDIPVKLPASGLKTMGRDFDVDLSNSTLTAYVATNATVQNKIGNATMEPIKVTGKTEGKYVPSRTGEYTANNAKYEQYIGVILKGNGDEEATYRIGEEETLVPSSTQKNYLSFATDATKVTMTEVKDGIKYTNLGMKDGKFRYFKQNGTIAYNKCWLSMPTSIVGELSATAGVKELNMNFISPTVDAIDNLEVADKRNKRYYYTLQGVRVENPKSGIYIHNGKKVIIK